MAARKSTSKKVTSKKDIAESTPIIERYRPRHTWEEFVALYIPASVYPTMNKEYLK